MIEFVETAERDGPLVALAQSIAALASRDRWLFIGLARVIDLCAMGWSADKISAGLNSCKASPDQVALLGKRLEEYFSCDPDNREWDLGYRRGRLVEEVVSTLCPGNLGLASPPGGRVLRAAHVRDGNGDRLCGEKNLDVVFICDERKVADGIECKASLKAWLKWGSARVRGKLNYLESLRGCLPEHGWAFSPWLAGLEPNLEPVAKRLAKKGHGGMGLIGRQTIVNAIPDQESA